MQGAWSGSSCRIAARAHAARIRRSVVLVVLLFFVEPVERAGSGAHDAADRGALARALPASGHRATRGADGRADHRPDRGVLHDLLRIVLLADLRGGVPIAGVDGLLWRDRNRWTDRTC